MAAHVMVNLTWKGSAPTLDDVTARFQVPRSAFDDAFGVIAVSPDEGVYTVRVEDRWAAAITGAEGTDGPFPDGRIEPFGEPG